MSFLTGSSLSDKQKEYKVPKNYYFIEEQIAPMIQKWQEYYQRQKDIQEYLENQDSEESELGYYTLSNLEEERLLSELKKNIQDAAPLLETIMIETEKVIKGVIFRAGYHKREKYDVCMQVATEACIKALPRFNPEYGTAFNYLSLTAKRSVIYYLIKKQKKRHLSLDYEYMDDENLKLKNLIKQEEHTLKNLEIENFTDTILNLINENNEHKSLHLVAEELREYLFYNQGKYDKKEFFKWSKADGISSNLLRKFVKFLREHKDFFYKEVGVY